MKPFYGYIILGVGILTGIAANSFAKISDGFTKLSPTIACILLMCVTMFSLAKAMSVLPVGFAYSTYSGLTVTGVLFFAMVKYNQIPNIYATVGIILIIIGVVMVNYLGKLKLNYKLYRKNHCKKSLLSCRDSILLSGCIQ